MIKRTGVYVSIHVIMLAALLFVFSGKVLPNGVDPIFHYALIHSIFTKLGVLGTDGNSVMMTMYPSASHWLAAIVGWGAGSDFVGMMAVTIISLYLIYFLVALIVQRERSIAALLIFSLFFLALSGRHTQIGWEIIENFFYPQLVGDVPFFATLFWLSSRRSDAPWTIAVIIPILGIALMWLQPLNAVHVLGAGIALSAFYNVMQWRDDRLTISRALSTVFLIAASGAIVGLHPKLEVMRVISQNDGALRIRSFGLVMTFIVLGCALPGAMNLRRYYRSKGSRTDAVVGSAVLASIGLAIAQYAIFYLTGVGSYYAFKKHAFLIVTLGAINLARLATRPVSFQTRPFNIAPPFMATLATIWILYGQGVPSAPLFEAISFANRAVADLPELKAGNTVYAEPSAPPLIQLLISVAGFNFPISMGFPWLTGTPPQRGSKYAMVRRTEKVDETCPDIITENADFAVIRASCLDSDGH